MCHFFECRHGEHPPIEWNLTVKKIGNEPSLPRIPAESKGNRPRDHTTSRGFVPVYGQKGRITLKSPAAMRPHASQLLI